MKKNSTEAVKSLLGLQQRNLWECRPTVAVMPRLSDVMARLVYLFCKPAKAGLVDSIDDHPGLNSWHAFTTCEPCVDATISIPVRYYHKVAIPRLPDNNILDAQQDLQTLELLKQSEDVFEHTLVLKPLAWLRIFGITNPKRISAIRKRIIQMVREREAKYRAARTYPVIGAEALRRFAYFTPHTPAKKDRKVFVFCSDAELRKKIIVFVRSVSEVCRTCYEQAKKGLSVVWPPGAFIPWLPPLEFCSMSP